MNVGDDILYHSSPNYRRMKLSKRDTTNERSEKEHYESVDAHERSERGRKNIYRRYTSDALHHGAKTLTEGGAATLYVG
jgi:hypothetical protein